MNETNQLLFMCEQFQKMRHKSLVLMTLCALVITSWMFLCQNTLSQLLIPQVKLVDVLAQQEIHSVQSDAPSLKVSPIPKAIPNEIAQKTPKSIPNAEPLSTKYLFLILSSPGNSALRSTLRSSGWLSHPWAHNGTIHGVHNGTIHGVHNGTIQFRYYFVTSRISPGTSRLLYIIWKEFLNSFCVRFISCVSDYYYLQKI